MIEYETLEEGEIAAFNVSEIGKIRRFEAKRDYAFARMAKLQRFSSPSRRSRRANHWMHEGIRLEYIKAVQAWVLYYVDLTNYYRSINRPIPSLSQFKRAIEAAVNNP